MKGVKYASICFLIVTIVALVLNTGPSSSTVAPIVALEQRPSAAQRPHRIQSCSLEQDQEEFVRLAHYCTDKTTVHHYEGLYARVFYRYRHITQEHTHRVDGKPLKLLEMGVGCKGMPCVAGGFRLMQAFVPSLAYHGLDLEMDQCHLAFQQSGVNALDAAYLLSHSCAGSNQDDAVITNCSARFGPFEVVIDDASHFQSHVCHSYETLFDKLSVLNPGGFYVVEDLQAGFSKYKVYESTRPFQLQNKTFPTYARNMMLCWLRGDCYGHPAVTRRNAGLIDTLAVFHESLYLRKAFDDSHQFPSWYVKETPECLHNIIHGLSEQPARNPAVRIRHSVNILEFNQACSGTVSLTCKNLVLPLFSEYKLISYEKLALLESGGGNNVDKVLHTGASRDGSYAVVAFDAAEGGDNREEEIIGTIVTLLQSPHVLGGCVIAITGLKRGESSPHSPLMVFLSELMMWMLSYSPSLKASLNVHEGRFASVSKIGVQVGEVTFVSQGEIVYITKVPLRLVA